MSSSEPIGVTPQRGSRAGVPSSAAGPLSARSLASVVVPPNGSGAVPQTIRKGSPARAGDRRAEWIRGAVARYERPLTQYAAHLLGGDLDRARDLVQEAFLRLCDQAQESVDGHLAEWLYTVCRNLAIDQKRKDRRVRPISDEQRESFAAGQENPPDAAERVDAYGRVVEAMAGLPTRQQEIVRLKFQHGLSYKEIGKAMDLTATNVGFILHTAMKALRTELGVEGEKALTPGSEAAER